MGEIVYEVATTLLGKIASKAYQDIALAWGLQGDVEKLRNSMKLISAFLIDAENKQFKNESITEWLRQLRQAFHDASDMLDETECEAKINEVVKMYGSVSEKVMRFFSGSNPLVFRVKMAHKIKDIKEKIDEIASYRSKFGLIEQHANNMALDHRLPWRETQSSIPSRVTGRDVEKEKIISFLMSPPVKNIDVIPIVAMGGWGKTTLAQLAYNDSRVIDHFKIRMWVHVSNDFDVKTLTSKILKAADIEYKGGDNPSLDELQIRLGQKLNNEKFLLVLDDVWNEDAKKWHDLGDLLIGKSSERSKSESKIIVTTRSHKVASIMGTVSEINLEQLPQEECLELFAKCAFQGEEEAERHPRLKEIGKKIVKKCQGVPLAVVALGCMLNSQREEKEWKKILDSEMWEIDHQKDDDILPALRPSYFYLPSHLKQCFYYCAVFPKGYQYSYMELIPFWMSRGLLQPTNENEEPEYLGELYLKQLVSASLFQVQLAHTNDLFFKITGIYDYDITMHDLVHDLAKLTMANETAVITSESAHVNEQVRHLSISNNGDRVPSLPRNLTKLRSFRTHVLYEGERITITEPFVKWICKEFKFLRVLDLTNSNFKLLPDCFGKMKHLKYLCLMNCYELEELPSSICKLYNLQYLDLRDCRALQELPKNMGKLVNLRILIITTAVTNLYSIDVRCFKSIQILVICGCSNLVVLPRALRHLTTLKRMLITNCQKLARFEDDDEEGGKKNEVVKDLSLQTFAVSNLPQLKALPNWLERSAKTLQYMVIAATSLTALPEWLPKLMSLESLYIRSCSGLLSLPNDMNHIRSLGHLYISDCPKLAAKCRKDEGPEWSKIAHVQNVHIKLCEHPWESDASEDMEG